MNISEETVQLAVKAKALLNPYSPNGPPNERQIRVIFDQVQRRLEFEADGLREDTVKLLITELSRAGFGSEDCIKKDRELMEVIDMLN